MGEIPSLNYQLLLYVVQFLLHLMKFSDAISLNHTHIYLSKHLFV